MRVFVGTEYGGKGTLRKSKVDGWPRDGRTAYGVSNLRVDRCDHSTVSRGVSCSARMNGL
jgi:hypothetical protein